MNHSKKQPIKMTPGDDIHLSLLMAPFSLNLVTGQDRQHLLGYGRAAFEAGKAGQCLHQIQEPSPMHDSDCSTHNAPAYPSGACDCSIKAASEAVAEQALLKVLRAIQRYLPPDGVDGHDTLAEIIGIVDPWPLGELPEVGGKDA